ncbi:unnamed protein product [Paramecium octaurelia]|uniref:Uncharacterized protein n=1 Tax=Paramecium octaurelia TaxID=43137 RepID=A0A8S1VEB4_PAROT|nr:unnamed protein product [Paramecium octaurelia]
MKLITSAIGKKQQGYLQEKLEQSQGTFINNKQSMTPKFYVNNLMMKQKNYRNQSCFLYLLLKIHSFVINQIHSLIKNQLLFTKKAFKFMLD